MTDVRERLIEVIRDAQRQTRHDPDALADAILAAFPELAGWQPIATADGPGPFLTYYPPETRHGRVALCAMVRYETLPVIIHRQPTMFKRLEPPA